MNDGLIAVLLMLIYCGSSLGLIIGIWHIMHYLDEKPKLSISFFLKWIGWTVLVLTIFSTTGSLPEQVTEITEITKSELQNEYKLNNDLTTGKAYAYYKFVNIKTGQVIVLSDKEYLKINCNNFKINVFEVKRVHNIIGQRVVHDYYNINSQIECIN